MSSCKDCVHYEVCKFLGNLYSEDEGCRHFKPKSRFVEVVRCKECTSWQRKIGFIDSPNGHCFYHCEDTNQYDFCSYGEKALKEREKE